MNTYNIQVMRFVPGYNDWDADEVFIKAESEDEARQKFRNLKWYTSGGISVKLVETPTQTNGTMDITSDNYNIM